MAERHVGTHHRKMVSYPHSLRQSLYTLILIPLLSLGAAFVLLSSVSSIASSHVSAAYLIVALLATFARLCVAYVLALVLSVPLALLVTGSTWAERVFLPLFDVMQSLPVLAFFPIIIVFFLHWGLWEGAAVFVLFVSMLWSIIFSLVGGLRVIPQDIKDAGRIFGLSRWRYVEEILLPATFPYLVTGSLLAFAGGWNIVIVAEVLHTYLPGASASSDLFGIGSTLVHASATGQEGTFLFAILTMVLAIALLNFFLWQRLLKYAERFKFE